MSPNKPIDRIGFQWIKKMGCDCKECPWGQNCIGRQWANYVEIKDEKAYTRTTKADDFLVERNHKELSRERKQN